MLYCIPQPSYAKPDRSKSNSFLITPYFTYGLQPISLQISDRLSSTALLKGQQCQHSQQQNNVTMAHGSVPYLFSKLPLPCACDPHTEKAVSISTRFHFCSFVIKVAVKENTFQCSDECKCPHPSNPHSS